MTNFILDYNRDTLQLSIIQAKTGQRRLIMTAANHAAGARIFHALRRRPYEMKYFWWGDIDLAQGQTRP